MKSGSIITSAALALTVLAGVSTSAVAAAPSAAPTVHHASKAHRLRTATPPGSPAARADRMHLEVALARGAEQQHLIAQGLRAGRIDPARAEVMERDQARIDAAIARFAKQGPISVDQALALQHQQDIQDWAIRSARAGATHRS